MNNLIKVVDNTSETLDEQLFGQFMKRSQYGTTQVLVKRIIFHFLMMTNRNL